MKKIIAILILLLSVVLINQCSQQIIVKTFPANHPAIQYTGRIDFSDPEKPKLVGPGCYLQVRFKGRSCEVLLTDQNFEGKHNYMAIILDGEYKGRIKVDKEQTVYRVADELENEEHSVLIGKATEAGIGYVEFSGIRCGELLPSSEKPQRKIEFIGNSITCGMGLDLSGLPCDSAEWYDQHNACLAFGPLLARQLNAQWLLSSVSGIGIERNWNSPGPTMPLVYYNTYFRTDSSALWNFSSYVPDLVSICLGTNDFSDGDEKIPRVAVDSSKFVSKYIQFLITIRKNYPQAVICCVSSPILQGIKARTLERYISIIVDYMIGKEHDSKVFKFFFTRAYTHGCSSHPGQEDHVMMADELQPFIAKIMRW